MIHNSLRDSGVGGRGGGHVPPLPFNVFKITKSYKESVLCPPNIEALMVQHTDDTRRSIFLQDVQKVVQILLR